MVLTISASRGETTPKVQTGETEMEGLMRLGSPAAILMDKHDDISEQVEELMEC